MSSTTKSPQREIIEVDNPTLGRTLHIADIVAKPAWYNNWEHRRPQWLHECAGEFFGVFFYCYAGLGATGAMILGNTTEQPFLGNLFSVGFAYAMGITFAITVCAMSSGGHFNPAVTVAFAIWRGFPLRKVPQYIFAQLLGAFVATLVVYGQYRPYILELEALLIATGKEAVIFSANGPAGIFSIYANPGIPLRWTFMNEFFADFFLGLIIWGVLDPSNIFVSSTTGPILVAMGYATVIWGYVPGTVATNPARDLGCRLATIAIWGTKAWGGHYPAISALTSFPATLFAATVYELFLSDSSRVVTLSSREVIANSDRHKEHQAWKYNLAVNQRRERALSRSLTGEKAGPDVERLEKSSGSV